MGSGNDLQHRHHLGGQRPRSLSRGSWPSGRPRQRDDANQAESS